MISERRKRNCRICGKRKGYTDTKTGGTERSFLLIRRPDGKRKASYRARIFIYPGGNDRRYKRMRGYDVFYPFGFDDNGLPTERLVEKDSGIRAADMPGSLFREKCMETIAAYEADFKSMWQRLGLSVDWSLQYQTVSDNTRRISQRAFLELVKQKRAYRKESPVLWCTQCRTSIAQAELEMKEQESVFNYLAFEAEGETLLIATTRPELLYGCVCVFVNPEDERYRHLAGKKARVPLYGFEIPVLTDEQASMDKGTGAVMCATYGIRRIPPGAKSMSSL